MADVFLSYARDDKALAERIATTLVQRGRTVWWDPTIPAGVNFRNEIRHQLEIARCVVVLWTQHSITSEWVMDEADDGKRRGVLVQVLVQNVLPPHGFRSYQYADLVGWNGDPSFPGFVMLEGGVEHCISRGNELSISELPATSLDVSTIGADRPSVPNRVRWLPWLAASVTLLTLGAGLWLSGATNSAGTASNSSAQLSSPSTSSDPLPESNSPEPTGNTDDRQPSDSPTSSRGRETRRGRAANPVEPIQFGDAIRLFGRDDVPIDEVNEFTYTDVTEVLEVAVEGCVVTFSLKRSNELVGFTTRKPTGEPPITTQVVIDFATEQAPQFRRINGVFELYEVSWSRNGTAVVLLTSLSRDKIRGIYDAAIAARKACSPT